MRKAIERIKTYSGFELRSIVIQNKVIPIVTQSSKLVVYPSRFILYSIEKGHASSRKALKYLKILVRFIDYLSHRNNAPSPDELLLSVRNNEIEKFLGTGGNRSKDVSRRLLIFDFYTWLEREEGVTLSEITFKYNDL